MPTRWRSGQSVRLAVGRLWLHSSGRVKPKSLKKCYLHLPCLRSALNGGCWEQVGKFACCVLAQDTHRDAPTFVWKTAQFSLRREGWWQEGHPNKKKCHVIQNADQKLSAVANLIGKKCLKTTTALKLLKRWLNLSKFVINTVVNLR